jgi:PleD family two-component response regulator
MFQIRYIEEFTLQLNNSNQLRFTASLGVSQVNILTDHDIEFCIKRADDGLYEAKNSSKNKVCIKVS